MAVDPNANAQYVASKDVQFAKGQSVWVNGIQFVVSNFAANGVLTLTPVNVKT